MKKVFCFGELLLRMSPELGGAWIKNASMPVFVGGAELNAATALARWNVPVAYGTAIPENALSKEISFALEEKGIDTSGILYTGKRIGCYYLPQGADLKNAGVIYDREYSSFSQLKPGQIDWENLLKDVSWFHFSAISPALNADVAAVCKEGLEVASAKGITISVDLNYRAKLWQYGKKPVEVMPELVQYCDVIMGNLWAEEVMLGIPVPENLLREKEALIKQAQSASEQIMKGYRKCRQVANTFRFDVNQGVKYYATLFKEDRLYLSNEHNTELIIDKVGSGDTFMAGLIYGNYQGLNAQEIIDFSASAAFTKLFIKGDATTASVEEIRKGELNYA
jgi:2-dehydro-3-deoxygluconokinase